MNQEAWKEGFAIIKRDWRQLLILSLLIVGSAFSTLINQLLPDNLIWVKVSVFLMLGLFSAQLTYRAGWSSVRVLKWGVLTERISLSMSLMGALYLSVIWSINATSLTTWSLFVVSVWLPFVVGVLISSDMQPNQKKLLPLVTKLNNPFEDCLWYVRLHLPYFKVLIGFGLYLTVGLGRFLNPLGLNQGMLDLVTLCSMFGGMFIWAAVIGWRVATTFGEANRLAVVSVGLAWQVVWSQTANLVFPMYSTWLILALGMIVTVGVFLYQLKVEVKT